MNVFWKVTPWFLSDFFMWVFIYVTIWVRVARALCVCVCVLVCVCVRVSVVVRGRGGACVLCCEVDGRVRGRKCVLLLVGVWTCVLCRLCVLASVCVRVYVCARVCVRVLQRTVLRVVMSHAAYVSARVSGRPCCCETTCQVRVFS
jgi:hypothetical protein